MDVLKAISNNAEWVKEKLNIDSQYFENLSKGQSPEILYIGCSDSRVTAEQMMGAEAGEIFVHRNIANMVPNTDLSSMSVIEYAVSHLKVKHVVVCGHYYCGGVKAAMSSADLGVLNPWLRQIRDVYRTHQQELDAIQDENAKYNRLIELNAQEQCINVIKTPAFQKAKKEREIEIHAWVFDIKSGKIIDLNVDFEKEYQALEAIYKID